MSGDGKTALFVEGDIADTTRFGLIEIVTAGIAAVGRHLPGRGNAVGDVAVEHRQKALGIGRIAGFDDEIEDQATLAGDKVELVAILHVAATLDDNVGVRLEQADQLFPCRHRLAMQHPALALVEDARDQRQVMVDLGAPVLDHDAGARSAAWRLAAAPHGWHEWQRSACDRADTGCLCHCYIGYLPHSVWPSVGDHASGSPRLPAVWPPDAAVATSRARHPTIARCRSDGASEPR